METSFISGIIQTFLALIVVCGLIYISFRIILPKLTDVNFNQRTIKIVERIQIDTKKSLLVVNVGGKWVLIGTAENNISLISELGEKEIEIIEAEIAERKNNLKKSGTLSGTFAEKLAEIMNKKGEKK